MATLKTVFKENGTVTAANASPMSDGAAALVICSKDVIDKYRLPILAKIIGWADASQSSVDFPTSPSLAIPKALGIAGKDLSDIEIFEINEAFSSVALANMKILKINHDKINVWGGAIALGHPLGWYMTRPNFIYVFSSGARITGSLPLIMKHKKAKYGVAAVCNGGGGASAIVLEAPND